MRRFRDYSGCSFPSSRPWKVDGKVNEQRSRWTGENFFPERFIADEMVHTSLGCMQSSDREPVLHVIDKY